MIKLDGGVNPTAHRLLAIARARLGDLDGCRAAAIAEVQARSFNNFPSMPGATRTISVDEDRGVEPVERRWREGLPADVHPTLGELDLFVARAR